MLEALPPDFPKNGVWLEPCAGTGAIIRATEGKPELVKPDKWLAVDLSRSWDEVHFTEAPGISPIEWRQGDFLEPWTGGKVDVIVTNPPYSLAEDFITQALKIAPNVVMLLRLNFLASEKRSRFMRAHTPDVYVLPNRPGFTTDGHTDSIEYAWFRFYRSGISRTDGRIKVLNSTPKGERARFSRQGPKAPMEECTVSDPPA
jgi:hypothetical protein